MNYFAKGNQVFYIEGADLSKAQPFVTVHPTNSTRTPEQIAVTLSEMFNLFPAVEHDK